MKALSLLLILSVSACGAAPGPSPGEIARESAAAADARWEAYKADRDRKLAEYLAKQDADRAAEQARLNAQYQAREAARKAGDARLIPQVRTCILQTAQRLAQTSAEAADLVADAVLAECHPIISELAEVEAFNLRSAADYAAQLKGQLRPRVIATVVEVRARPVPSEPASKLPVVGDTTL